ncbi:MAG: hypothetical protein PHY15_06740 [Eubacteriales bacterium]|nr:hypothetical protein [Eubacteriales bacterium]
MDLNYYKRLYGQLLDDYHGRHGELRRREAEKSLKSFADTYVKDGIVRWQVNNRIPPHDLLLLWHGAGEVFDLEKTVQERAAEAQDDIENYKKANKSFSDEEMFEMRSAFGEGTTVVDVLSGRKIKL